MYVIEDGLIYSMDGGYVNIPQEYKSRDKDDNLVISADFFKDYPTFFTEEDGKLYTDQFTLKQKVVINNFNIALTFRRLYDIYNNP